MANFDEELKQKEREEAPLRTSSQPENTYAPAPEPSDETYQEADASNAAEPNHEYGNEVQGYDDGTYGYYGADANAYDNNNDGSGV